MLRAMKMLALAVLMPLAFGCGQDGTSGAGVDAPTADGTTGQPDAPPIPEGYTRLIGRTWDLPAGATDTYRCVRFTVPQDTYITNIIAQAPFGTHHTVLSIAGANGTAGADGEQNCSVTTLGMQMLYASGVGTSPLDFPDGVGIKVSAGQQIHLNLHLFNTTDAPISGDSAILVKSQPTPPPILAEMVFAGKVQFSVPTGMSDLKGGCMVSSPYTLFAVWPHMHQIATHQKVTLTHGATTTVLHDGAYSFLEQTYYLKTPEVAVAAGDKIEVTCSYNNTTGSPVTFGESSTDEMCFSGLYRYPAANAGLFQCSTLF
jgi:hypothetical protein